MLEKLKKYHFFQALITLKIITVVVSFFGPFPLPHTIRQIDTMGVSLRYWMRWTIESDFSLLPAVLASGDGIGIQAMEFPTLNILFAPVFALPFEEARTILLFLYLFLMLGLTSLSMKVWGNKEFYGIKVSSCIPLLLLMGNSQSYFFRFMPDYMSLQLVLLAAGLGYKDHWHGRTGSFIFLSLGLLMKPPSVVALGILLLDKSFLRLVKNAIYWIFPAFIITLLYYTEGVSYLRSISDLPAYFYTEIRNPLSQIQDFFSNGPKIFDLLLHNIFGKFLLIPLIMGTFFVARKGKFPGRLFAVFGLQLFTIILLNGKHSFTHDYYFIGTSLTAVFLILAILSNSPNWLGYLFFLILTINIINEGSYRISNSTSNSLYQECASLKEASPSLPWGKAYVFRSYQGPVPYLGLCFGERQGSIKNKYGFFYLDEEIPESCSPLKLSKNIQLVKCQ